MKIQAIILVAFMALGLSAYGNDVDTIRVINNPGRVVITEKNGTVSVQVKDESGDASKDYKYDVRRSSSSLKLEDYDDDDEDADKKWDLFVGGLYVGWGHSNGHDAAKGATGLSREVGILNLLGVSYNFNPRSSLSLGAGVAGKWYNLKSEYLFEEPDPANHPGMLTVNRNWPAGASKTKSTFSNVMVQFPLLYHQGFGKKFNIMVGPVLNWNVYATNDNIFDVDRTTTKTSTKGMHQRKVTVDGIIGVGHRAVGVYFRYSPMNIFENGYGPKINNTWTLGLMIGL